MVNTADAVVIGGGINGTNIAWRLARRKAGKVFLLEKNAIASGASGKSGAPIGSHFGTEIKVWLALKGMETWKNFNEVYGVNDEYYDRCGRVWLVPKEDADAMRGIVEMQRRLGSDARILTKEELREHAPQVSSTMWPVSCTNRAPGSPTRWARPAPSPNRRATPASRLSSA
jgi:sarcosine oxidase subunit beta